MRERVIVFWLALAVVVREESERGTGREGGRYRRRAGGREGEEATAREEGRRDAGQVGMRCHTSVWASCCWHHGSRKVPEGSRKADRKVYLHKRTDNRQACNRQVYSFLFGVFFGPV